MAKSGLIHDYDLWANHESSAAGVTCKVCDTENITFQWSDLSGEAMCTRCGCPYQLKWGTDAQVEEAAYPYLNLREDFIPVAREFWNDTGMWVHYGLSISRNDGMAELTKWLRTHRPEFVESEA